MIVLQSTYDAKCLEARAYKHQLDRLTGEWNALVRKINAKGGAKFLSQSSSQFTQGEIQKLVMLCHPDKHDGKPMATEMTQKLLKLKGAT